MFLFVHWSRGNLRHHICTVVVINGEGGACHHLPQYLTKIWSKPGLQSGQSYFLLISGGPISSRDFLDNTPDLSSEREVLILAGFNPRSSQRCGIELAYLLA